jgi:uncharacterized membrane protein
VGVVRKWLPGVLILAAYLFSAAVYSHLPARIPSHWGVNGPNAWSSRFRGAFLLPSIALVFWLVRRWIPKVDPRRANYEKFGDTYDLVILAVIAILLVIHVAALGSALGWPIRVERLTPGVVGVVFIVIGNVLPRARPNWFFGIRTPWTLSNDIVWERTHRVGGYLMMTAGVFIVLSTLVSPDMTLWVLLFSLAVLTIVLFIYSYLQWRRQNRR